MKTLSTLARVNANDLLRVKVDFLFLESEPYIIKMIIHDNEGEAVWDVGRTEMRDAIFSTLPAGLFDIIMIKSDNYLRMYLRNETDKCSLDFNLDKLAAFVFETYKIVTSKQEQDIIRSEIEEWISQ